MSTTTVRRTVASEPVYRKSWLRRIGGARGLGMEFAKYFLLAVLSISFMLPFYWMASSALKDDTQIYVVPPKWVPNPVHWENFINAWNVRDFNQMTFNTVVRYALPATFGTILSSVLVAYGFSRIRWRGRDWLFAVVLATMMIPYQVRLVPLFVIFKNLGWLNSYKPMVIPAFFASPFYIFMLRQFFRGIPTEMSEAAKIDGANELDILFRIILPLSTPALMVVGLFTLLGCWNDYLGPLIYANKEPEWTLALGVNNLRNALNEPGFKNLVYPFLMAVSTIITAPILVAFFFAQRTFIEGIAMTGLKG
jgi:ABC-type glycerol-3-phosphate transport system permease component